MEVTADKIIVWLIAGALAGWLTGMLIKRRRKGFGHLYNTIIGLVGALIGGFIFHLLQIDFGLGRVSISLRDLLSAVIGSLVFLIVVWLIRKGR
jgi:uncharacterized membrane protein YeaQ/YmgE (transglycosylase-associated protein family)